MASIIDDLEVERPKTELAELQRQLNDLDPDDPDDRQREDELDWAVGQLLAQPLSASARRKLATMLVPVWAQERLLGSLAAWAPDKKAWLVTLRVLSDHRLSPVIDSQRGVCGIITLSEFDQSARERSPEPCRTACDDTWADFLQEGWLYRLCHWCGHGTRAPVPEGLIPPPEPDYPGQGTLW